MPHGSIVFFNVSVGRTPNSGDLDMCVANHGHALGALLEKRIHGIHQIHLGGYQKEVTTTDVDTVLDRLSSMV
jgi:hypothetical protein